jgi:hypothetical protein
MSALEGSEQPIEFDSTVVAGDDNNSVFGGQSVESSTASLASSIWEQRTVLGRAYQASKTTEYWAPNDDKHVEAFDVAHHWLTMMLDNKLYAAPIGENPQVSMTVASSSSQIDNDNSVF